MILRHFSIMWVAIAPAVVSHLWQSTLFALSAGLLTLVLRKNRARVRYWLWLAASMKFLVPFALLVSIGSYFAKPRARETQSGLYAAIEEVAQSCSLCRSVAFAVIPGPGPQSSKRPKPVPRLPLPALLGLVWACGFIAVLCLWSVRWRRMCQACQGAIPLREGREIETLRRLERQQGIGRPMAILLSHAPLEPGILGIVRPVLVWPAGISERLEDAHLEAVLAHELWHVRRRDNLAAALHMAVEAIFWFHPLVWWLGGRLIEERERACDEAVLQSGNEPRVYAESILKTCEFCVGAPLACAAGVTGSDLKNRVVRIMTQRSTLALAAPKRVLLVMATLVAVGLPVVFGLANGPQNETAPKAGVEGPAPKFEVASIKPDKSGMGSRRVFFRIMDPANDGRFYATGPTLRMLLRIAYGVQDSQIIGGPGWMNTERFDIQAKADDSVNKELRKLSAEKGVAVKHRMLQALLADRFKLTIRQDTKELPLYALVAETNGPKLQEAKDDGSGPRGGRGQALFRTSLNGSGAQQQATFQDTHMRGLAEFLAQQLGRAVLDQTGLKGTYNFSLKWTPDESQRRMFGGPGPVMGPAPGGAEIGGGAGSAAGGSGQAAANMPAISGPDSAGPSIFTAIREQLGLKLESQKGPVEVLVIEHVEQPSED
jgi:bla regulator protein blaR1